MICKKCNYSGRSKRTTPITSAQIPNTNKLKPEYDMCPQCQHIQLKDKKYKVTLELTDTQAFVIQKALDSYSRMLMGQLDVALDPAHWENYSLSKQGLVEDVDWYNDAMPHINELKKLLFGMAPNANYGIFSKAISDNARVAWDIHQVLRNKMSWYENPKGGMTVNFDRPLKSSSTEDLPVCEIKPEKRSHQQQ